MAHNNVTNATRAKENEEKIRMLVYPCYLFDLASSFARLTRLLVYNFSRHIAEYNPMENYHLHLDGNMIGKWISSVCVCFPFRLLYANQARNQGP